VPVANAGAASTTSGVPVAISLTGSDVETCELTFNTPAMTTAGGTLSAPTAQGCATGTPNTDAASVTYTPPGGGFSGPDSFSFTVHDGTTGSAPKTISITVNPSGGGGGGSVTLSPVADAQVRLGNTGTNYGALSTIRIGGETGTNTYRTYLRFNVTGVSGPVTGVRLRLYASDASPNIVHVWPVTDTTWIETGSGSITWTNKPPMGTPELGSRAVPTLNAYNEIVLSPSAVAGNGLVSLGLTIDGTNSAIFHSKEGANDPQLVVTFGGGGSTAAASEPSVGIAFAVWTLASASRTSRMVRRARAWRRVPRRQSGWAGRSSGPPTTCWSRRLPPTTMAASTRRS
jgi:hypothetical protein